MSKKVLLVDDSQFMRNILKNILINDGFEICGEASNGLEGISKYKELNPDLVMMDIIMDNMNGITSLKKIKEYDKNANIVMCTSMGQKPMILESIKYGAKDFIVKPFRASQITEVVTRNLLN